jgi:DNA-binding LytR/AlgR family response regulator
MDRYLQEKKTHNRYTFELKDGIMVQYADDIVYAEALGHSVTLHCISGDYQLAVTLKSVTGILAKERFLRVHKSFLVNTDYIRKLEKTSLTLSVWDDRQLPISKNNAYNIRQDFLRIQGSEDIM